MRKQKAVCPYREAMEHAYETDAKLSSETSFKWLVTINHHDLTSCMFPNARVEEYNGWLIVYTEHNGFHIFLPDAEDLKWRKFKMS